ncbi:amino acid adenylation domain-containing protein [Streptomyces sp. NBC_01637]|uniref:amino acid adenylation domain-containing protein n=1 Tax=unclassified Streptomyces TaxID=2593676 RepID=UPI00386345AE|nr:amino acid adenylation domain-containing protein [Streptomyces sp. NBC_01653]WTC84568.1 amino acid adenylation domain-containing protein [Streptomyces sp. NBC_01653]WTD86299.1 amino acid adenylation domain-containing protein [Streptomyces sp. NBC_01637]WTD94225.1 amino acid adenylation domain-containing protein [Streptomyces sp. NBC_01637]
MVTIDEAFRHWVNRTPDAIALHGDDAQLTYRELDTAATRLADRLRRLGVRHQEMVGVAAVPSTQFVVNVLAALRAGAAYVPFDLGYPDERLDHMRRDSGIRVIIADSGENLPAGLADCRILDPHRPADDTTPVGPLPDPVPLTSGDLAYAMYTSGSTGLPKAVLVEQRNVTAFCRTQDLADLGPGRTMLQSSSFSFDASVLEIWGTLLNGACLAFPPEDVLCAADLAHAVAARKATGLWLSAGLFHQLVEEDPRALANLRNVVTGGDVVSPTQVRRALAANPGLTVTHVYGPTETTVVVVRQILTDPARLESPLPLGTPLPGVRIHVVDEDGRPLPPGETGELLIAGDTVSRGYHDRPDLTARRYVPEPGTGRRAYRSGDLGRLRPDGTVEFAGRADHQVKIRGYRIEPGEIEAALGALAGVRACLVVARPAPPGDKRVVAYVVPDTRVRPTAAGLHRALADRLPQHMLPAEYVALHALPLDANGKEDRRRLPEPQWGRGVLADLDPATAPHPATRGSNSP